MRSGLPQSWSIRFHQILNSGEAAAEEERTILPKGQELLGSAEYVAAFAREYQRVPPGLRSHRN